MCKDLPNAYIRKYSTIIKYKSKWLCCVRNCKYISMSMGKQHNKILHEKRIYILKRQRNIVYYGKTIFKRTQ